MLVPSPPAACIVRSFLRTEAGTALPPTTIEGIATSSCAYIQSA